MKTKTLGIICIAIAVAACSQLPIKAQIKAGHFRLENFSADSSTRQDRVYLMCYRKKPVQWAEPKQYLAGEHQLWVKASIEEVGLVKNLRVAHLLFQVKPEPGRSYMLNRELQQNQIAVWIQDAETGEKLSQVQTADLSQPLLVEANLRLEQCRQGSI